VTTASASAYFNAFLSVVHLAYKDNILSEDYATMIEKVRKDIIQTNNSLNNDIIQGNKMLHKGNDYSTFALDCMECDGVRPRTV